MNFGQVYAANPAPALEIAARGEVDLDLINTINEELNFPSLQKLRRVLDQRQIPYNKQSLERLVKSQPIRQVQAPGYRYDGKIASNGLDDRWFVDLIDFTASPSDGGKKTSLKKQQMGSNTFWLSRMYSPDIFGQKH